MALGTDENDQSGAGQSTVVGDGGGDALGGAGGRGARWERARCQASEEATREAESGPSAEAVPSSTWARTQLFRTWATGHQRGGGAWGGTANGQRQAGGLAQAGGCGRQATFQLGAKAQAQRRAQTTAAMPAHARQTRAPSPTAGGKATTTGGQTARASPTPARGATPTGGQATETSPPARREATTTRGQTAGASSTTGAGARATQGIT